MLLLLPSVSYLPFFKDFDIMLKFVVKKSPRKTIPMFYNGRCPTVYWIGKKIQNLRFSDSWRLVNVINHFRLSQIFYIGWLQLEAKYMRVSYREQKRRAKYMIVEIKSPRDKRLIRFLMVKVTGTSCACKKDDHNFRATNGDHMLEIRNSSTGSWITLLDLQVSELWARLLVSILTSITHTSFMFLFLGVFYFSVIIFIEFHGSSSNHDKTNGVSFPHYDARLVGPEARTHEVHAWWC